MMSHSMNLGEVAHFHPPVRVLTTIEREAANKRPTPSRILKRTQCKTCLGKACIGRCRFGD